MPLFFWISSIFLYQNQVSDLFLVFCFLQPASAAHVFQRRIPPTSTNYSSPWEGTSPSSTHKTALLKGVLDASATCFAIAKDHTFKSFLFFAKIRFFSQTKGLARQFLFACHAPSTAFFHSPQCSTSKLSIKCAGKEFKTPSYPCLRESMNCGER